MGSERSTLVGVALIAFSVFAGLAQAQADANQRRREAVYARVGASAITLGYIEDEVAKLPTATQATYAQNAVELRRFADDLVRYEVLAQAARAAGLADTRASKQLLEESVVAHWMREQVEQQLTLDSIAASDVAAYYEAHRQEFVIAETRRVSHILLATRGEAEQVLTEARVLDLGGFRALAERRSLDDTTKMRGGDLRYFDRQGRAASDETVPVAREIVDAAYALRESGDLVAAPVQVGSHYSVIKLTGIQAGHETTLTQATNDIRLRLYTERRQALIDQGIERARARFIPVLRPELLEHMSFDERSLDAELGPPDHAGGDLTPRPAPSR